MHVTLFDPIRDYPALASRLGVDKAEVRRRDSRHAERQPRWLAWEHLASICRTRFQSL
jgi:hypothetical protein